MAGAEKIGEAFVEFGGKKDTLAQDLKDAKRMTNTAFAEMGQMASRVSAGFVGAAAAVGAPTSWLAMAYKAVTDFMGLEDSVNDLRVSLTRMGEDGDAGVRKVLDTAHELQTEFRGISLVEVFGIARNLAQAGVPLDDLDAKLRAIIGHAGQLNMSFEEVTQRLIDIRQKGGSAVDLLKVPVAPGIPAGEQFAQSIAQGVALFPTAKARLDSLEGRWNIFKASFEDVFTVLGAWSTTMTGLSPGLKAPEGLGAAAEGAAKVMTGKTAAQRKRRKGFTSGAAGVLREEDLAPEPTPPTDTGVRPGFFSDLLDKTPVSPAGTPDIDAVGENDAIGVLNEIKEAIIQLPEAIANTRGQGIAEEPKAVLVD
jgi:hypothetical protein